MFITDKIHQLKIEFNVTENIKRFVYLYMITGEKIYLVDSGVSGSEKLVEAYLNEIDRNIEEVAAIFLTHAHPDHIGGAQAIKERSHCAVYASAVEKEWIENIDIQFKERPIPNFYQLVNQSVAVDGILSDGETINLEDGIIIKVMETNGHSQGELSFY